MAAAPVEAQDSVRGTRSEKLAEVSHLVDATLGRGHAQLVVRRTVHNGGERHDQAMFHIMLPGGAVATRLRTLGTAEGKPRWFEGELMEAEAAAAKYRELTGIGGYYPKDPALLSWRSPEHLALQVFPCPPGQPKTVEYTLTVPTTYEGGKHHLALPRVGTEDLAATAVLRTERGDRVFVGDERVREGASLQLDREIDVALEPRDAPTVGGQLAMVPFAKERVLVRFGIEAAPRLSAVPRAAAVVVLIDGSRSLDPDESAAAVSAARAYLGHFPDARAQVLTFDREVRARHAGFVPVADAIADLGRLTVVRRNGSRIDQALARASALLSKLPASTPRRVLVLTDLRTRAGLDPKKVHIAGNALVHIGVIEKGSPSLARDDEHAWAQVVRPTGGLIWRAVASNDGGELEAMRTVYEELARPLRIDRFRVVAPGIAEDDLHPPDRLDEGQGFTDLRIAAAPVASVTVRGELWSSPIEKTITADERESTRWAAMVFGSEILGELEEKEMMTLAMRGRAVSPVTSYLAIEPGVRPSTEGLEEGEGIGLGGIGTIGHGSGTGSGSGFLGPSFDREGFLRGALETAWKGCGGGGKKATVTLETTLAEVVEVPSVDVGDAGPSLQTCLSEATWALDLPPGFTDEAAAFTVAL